MITSIHTLIYSDAANATRAFLRDVLGWNYVAEDEGMNNLGNAIDYVPDWQFVSVNVNGEWAAENRPLVVRFLRALPRVEPVLVLDVDDHLTRRVVRHALFPIQPLRRK